MSPDASPLDSMMRALACVCAVTMGCTGVPETESGEAEFGHTIAAVTCDPQMTVFPVGSDHNIGYDRRSCATGTCVITCPDENANSDWDRSDHQGIDIFAFRGAPLVATADGTVIRVSTPSSTSGLRVRLRDDCGWEYYYGHMDSASVREGQRVSAGDVLGTMGNTGTSGVHLHFNISPDGEYSNDINPFPLLESTSGTACAPAPPPPPPPPPPEDPDAMRNDAATPAAVTPVGGLSRFVFTEPERVFDTRSPAASVRLIRSDGSDGPLTGTITGNVLDWPMVPESARGVWLNLAALESTTPGFVVAFPDGPAPRTSTLNFLDGQVRANAVPVPLDATRGASFVATSEVNLVADLLGVFDDEGMGLLGVEPLRVSDSRDTPGPIAADTPYAVTVAAPPGTAGVVASVAVISTGTQGFVSAGPCESPRPTTSNINFAEDGVRANTIISAIDDDELCFWSTAPVEISVDITGYLVPTGGLSYQAVNPVRLMDTREDDSLYVGRLGAGQTVEIPIASLAGAPADAEAAVVNLTVLASTADGFLTAYPCDSERPGTSNLNHRDGEVIGALAFSSLSAGNLCVYSLQRTDLIVDLLGVWVPRAPELPPPPPDAGVSDAGDDMGVPDADAGADASTPDASVDTGDEAGGVVSGCGCTVGAGSKPKAFAALALLGLVLVRRSRTRAHGPAIG